jgi:predicted nucleotidyltransferase component of viral defense system
MLIEATQRLWEIFKEKPELNGFVLIGGSALALQIHHRRSEDLDFAWPYGKLPREALDNLIRSTPSLQFILDQNEAAEREAEDCNLDLADHSQNYLVDGVRVTFFKSPDAESRLLQGSESDQVRVAKVPEIFALKALASADRSKSRDWFDLYTLFRSHGYTWAQFYAVFAEYSNDGQYKNAAGRLCSGIPQKDDEGYKTLVENPPQPEEIRDYFIARRNEFEKDSVHEGPQPHI